MQTEKKYLITVSRILDSIDRTGDHKRKEAMKRYLHKDIYPQMTYYGFKTIAEVRKSLDCMKAGIPDPTAENRYEYMKKVAGIIQVNIAEYEKSRGAMSRSSRLSLLYDKDKYRYLNEVKEKNDSPKIRDQREDFDRD